MNLTNLGDPDQSLIGGGEEKGRVWRGSFWRHDTLQLGFGSAIEDLGESTDIDFLKDTAKKL